MPWPRYASSTARSDSFVLPMHDRCGAAARPSARIASTVASVPSRVEPPAPKVTEQKPGLSCASCAARRGELRHALRRARRKELEAELALRGAHCGARCLPDGSSSDDSAQEMRL